jgi:predicted amidohydrolase YtcJ
LRTIFNEHLIAGGGSDHMQRIGPLRAVNPYDPFLGMWVTMTRRGQGIDTPLHPEEALTREQAIQFYTANNAYLMFLEDQVGTLEAGKLADFIILDRDLLTCPLDEFRAARPVATYLGGKLVYEAEMAASTGEKADLCRCGSSCQNTPRTRGSVRAYRARTRWYN